MINLPLEKKELYQLKKPYPYIFIDNILNETFAKNLQEEIMNLPENLFDKYNNPFESKLTLKDKNTYPILLQSLIDYLISNTFVEQLSEFTGYKLIVDTYKHYYGVHKYNNNDKLDIHIDASIHPLNKLKKQITLGIYLSKDWKEEYNGQLEIWKGDYEQIYECVEKIEPKFNRLVIFTCNDVSWHGNPSIVQCPKNAQRIFITLSYLSNNINYYQSNMRALFVKRPDDKNDEYKDKLRKMRSDNEQCNKVYNIFN